MIFVKARWGAGFMLTVAVAILSMLLITGCGPGTSGTAAGTSGTAASEVNQLIQEYPWLGSLGRSFVAGLVEEFGSDVADLLVAALAAIFG